MTRARTWEDKAQAFIAAEARTAWRRTNIDPRTKRQYKRHRPYSLSDEARELVAVLGWHDRKAAEIRAKEIMEGFRRAGVVPVGEEAGALRP